ncbi:MAG: hypothetical protein KatS3mg057_0257 [Herpetosiphonaceae bacterium]|nr:MAG: hypothetical protein KatS3mg057_0257 [Herpetosiphonaceae bacterium]
MGKAEANQHRLVIVIHHDAVCLDLIGEALKGEGYTAHCCPDEEAAYERIRSEQPAALVVNIRTDQPERGWTLLDRLRLDPLTAAIPVVICLPAGAPLQSAERLQQQGCFILERPIDRQNLLTAVQSAVAARDRSRSFSNILAVANGHAAGTETGAFSGERAAARGSDAGIPGHPAEPGASPAPAGAGQTLQEPEAHWCYRQAVEALRRGERDESYRLIRRALVHDPGYVPAWLHMAQLLDNIEQQRECLERALALDPHCTAAREQLDLLLLRTLKPNPLPEDGAERKEGARKLGSYLVEQGYITAAQLKQALQEQRIEQNRRGDHVPLGDILLHHGWLTPQMLATALVKQQEDKLQGSDANSPQHLGEYLIQKGILTPQQLAAVLAEQAQRRQVGERILLGELLIRGGYLSPAMLEQVLEEQRNDFFERFWS